MNFKFIAQLTDPATAEKLQSTEYFNRHISGQEQAADPGRLDDLTRGAVILGAEAVDYPLTDGIILYIKTPAGEVAALFIDVDITEQGGGIYEVLRISRAAV